MNEKVLQDLYDRAVSKGYKKGLEDFRTLIQTNQQVQDDNYAYVQSQGYKKSKEDFLGLLGMGQTTSTIPLKKKESAPNMGSSLADGSLEPSMPETTKRTLNQVGIGVRKLPDVKSFSQMAPPMQVEEAFNLIQGRGYKGTKEEFIAEYGIEVPQNQEEMYAKKDIFSQNIQNAFNAAARYSPTKVETKTVPAKVEPTMQEQAKQQFEEQFPKTLERIEQAPEEAREVGEYLQTVKESERKSELDRMKANQQDEEFMRLVSGIDNLTIKMSEEQAVSVLNERFKKYGIVFSEAVGGRDVLLARTADGKSSVEIPLTAFGNEGVLGERAKKLRDFIISNSKKADEPMTEDYITKSARAQTMRRVGRLNEDGSVSTVKFMSFEEDGKFKVAPTLFPKDPLNYGSKTSDWLELSPNDAIEEARRRGEVFEFKTKAEAEKFANGGWKDVTKSDIEGHKFFKDRGLDYFDYKTQRDELLSIDKEAAFISEVGDAIKQGKVNNAKQYYMKYASPEEASKYMYLLSGNNLRPDIESYQEKRQDQKNGLFAQVEDRTFFSDGKVQTTFEDFDLHLNNRAKVVSAEAAELKKKVKTTYQELDAISMEAFGVPAADLYSYKPKNQEEAAALNDIKDRISGLGELNQIAAEKYYSAQTYFDSKVNKAVQNEFEENMAGFWGEVNSAYQNGRAGYELMKYALGASTTEEASEMIAEAISNSESSSKSRAFQAFMSAGSLFAGDERAQRAFWSDPLEVSLNLIGTSMSQLLPIGLRVVPTTIGTGAAVGAGVAAAGTGGLGTLGGALSGGKYGFQTGMAIVNFAAEYTQSVLDAARESGYNISDGNSMAEALNDPEVWRKGNDIGIKRGIAIGGIDLLSSMLTGGVFKVSKLASKPLKVGAQVAERGLYDPAMEGLGEFIAQKWSTGDYDLKEIEAEMLGGIGNNSINAGMGVMMSSLKNTNLDLANSLTNVSAVAQESANDERISNWASNMRRLGQIDVEVEQRIQRNVGLRREARDVLSVGENGKTAAKDSKLQARIMELMQARDEMSATTNRKEVYRNQIAAVNEEIREIAETKRLRPAESQVNLQGINAPTTPKGVGVYKVNGTPMTKEKFLSTVNRMKDSRFNRSRIVVDNDSETEALILKRKEDAIQKQSTAQVPTQSEATVGEGVGEQVPGEEVIAGEGQEVSTEETQGKIAETRSRLDELKSSIPAPVAVTPEIIQQVQSESLAPEQLDGVLSSLADAVISGEELAPEQQALVSANKARVDELVSLKSEQEALSSEVGDLELMLSGMGGAQFRAEDVTTRDANWDAKTKEELPASDFKTEEEFQSEIRDGEWGMLTAENPNKTQISDAANKRANEKAMKWLESRGYKPQRIFGKYDNSENSFFVKGLTIQDAADFAREFAQDSVATDKGLVYPDGTMNPRVKGKEVFAPASNFYSTIKIGDKQTDFSVSYADNKVDSGAKVETKKPAKKTEARKAGENPLQDVESKEIGKFDPLEGAPRIQGLVGPDPNLVAVAEKYAAENGIPFVRQGEYVTAPEERGKRIAEAYANMKHDPNNPKVKEAYQDLIRQTKMQYQALVDAGYEFSFFDSETDPYDGNPSNAMRDLRNNKKMAVYGTYDGYGTEGITDSELANNPLLEDTGLRWKDQNGVEQIVTANDLFRAVHDAFGHGLEGASFRARGEENAWQAHVRLFTGPAVAAITSETRGQNSWLNFGPYGETNKTAKVEDTVFAEQKIGLMPEWTWTEGRAPDMPSTPEGPQARKIEGAAGVTEDAEFEAILDEMNNLESPLVEFSAGTEVDTEVETDVDELNSKLDTPLETVSIEILNGVPVLTTISDYLVASNEGVTDPVTGNKISKLFGGLGFNGIKRFAKAAWANVSRPKANEQVKKAREIYNNNKEVIEKFWADNPKYDGMVPMLVVKMGDDSILSNEALSRVVVDRINSMNLSETKKKAAFTELKKILKKAKEKYAVKEKENKLREKRGEQKKKIEANIIYGNTAATFILENSSSLDEALQRIFELPISPRAALIKMITSGNASTKTETFNLSKNNFIKAIIGKTKNNALLHIQSIIDVIADPSVANIPIGSVTSIVGVKVAEKQPDGSYKEAGGVINVDHPNYEYGAEGMSFGVLSKPLPVQSIMPSAYGAIIGKNIEALSEKKSPLSPSIALGIGMGLSEFMGRFVGNSRTKAMQLISLINRSFPNVSVYTTAEAFNNVITESGTRLQMKGDAILYGVTANGDIYINPDVHNSESDMFNTVIHEFGHVWLNMLATSEPGSKGRQLLERGISVLKEGIKTDPKLKAMFERQMEEFGGNEAAALNEMLAILIGNKGQQISDAATKSKFQEFLFAMWEYVRKNFTMSKDLSIEEIQDLSLNKFIETAVADMIQGEDMKISDKQLESMRSLTAMARAEDSMQSIIDLGRANGFSDQSIKEILLRRGFKANDINTALEVKVDLMTNLPQSFTNVQGGVKEGMKMYADVRQQLSKYARKKVKEADGKERTRTMSEVRQKAIELLKDHPIFKAQAKIVQDELLIGFDQSLSTRANRSVDAQISQIKKGLAAKKMGIKELAAAQKKLIDFISDVLPQTRGFSPARIERLVRLVGSTDVNNFNAQAERVLNLIEKQKELMAKKEIEAALKAQRKEIRDMRTGRKQLLAAQIQLKNYIRTTLPKSSAFTQAQINRLISAVTNTTLDNFSEQAQKVLDVVTRQLTKMSKAKVKEISAIINKSAKISSTQSGKRRVGRVDADTQSLFATMKSVFRAITMEARDGDSSAIDRIMDSVDPAVLASKGIDLDVVQQKLDNGEELTSQERAAFNTTIALQELEVVRDFLTGVTSAGVSPSPWQHMEALNLLAQRLKEIASEGIVRLKADKLVLSSEISSLSQQAKDQIKSDFGILYNEDGTLKGKNQLAAERRMIWENFRSLKVWEGIKGWVKTIDFQTVTGFQDFMRKKIYHLGTLLNVLDKGGNFFKKNVYDVLNRMDEATKRGYFNQIVMLDGLAGANGFKNYKDFTRSLSGPPVFLQVGTYKSPLNRDQILRLYALSKNDVQRSKLIEMGIDIDEIESALTDNQKAVADGVVDYLSNSYFDSVNNVYSYVNNVNLGFVSNYFPTKTIQTRIDGKVLESGDFGSTFNAETAPALKERTDTKGEIDIDGADFTSVLDAHFRSMEKYKAMAVGVRKIAQIFKLEDVVTLLEQTGTKPMIMRTLNFAINPESMTREPSTFVGKIATKFTGFALSFKAIQILKQGSSFVQAFEDYTVRKGKPTPVLDHIMFMVDMAYIIATLPKQIKKAYDMSANVKDRLDQGLEGDVYGLESGTGLFRPISKSSSAWAKAKRAFKTGAAAPTVLGDITGVLGYMAVYNRMIKQGFTQAEALEAFNNYNSTQQSRRATEKSPIQMSNNEFQRLFTMFGSTVFLQMNKTAQTSTNIMRNIAKGRMPKAKDVRGLMLNVAIANVLFVGAANIAKFIKGDEEDKEEALKAMRNALIGLNIIYSIPLIGSAVETMVSYAEGDFKKADDTVNPFMSIFRKYQKSDQLISEGEVWGAAQPIVEIVIGAQLDPFIGIYNYFGTSDQKEEDAAMYDMLGITPSYRPDTEEKQQGGMNKEDMKRYFPDLYDDVYGPNSPGYDVREEMKEMDREINKEMQAIKDEAYGK